MNLVMMAFLISASDLKSKAEALPEKKAKAESTRRVRNNMVTSRWKLGNFATL